MELISVIVPVYKVEAYLDKCVFSIVNQTYKNLEIILVDDGSPDSCPDICDEWAKKDSRIKVIHKENGGAGKARNTALKIAKGDLIAFVDSDDFLHCQMYEYLYSLMTPEIDIAECEILYTSDESFFETDTVNEKKLCSAEEAMRYHIIDECFKQTPPNKLYRRKTLENVFFPEGNKIDDEFFTYKAIGNSNKLIHSSRKMYAYRQQEGSVMHNLLPCHRFQGIIARAQRHKFIADRFPALVPISLCNLWFSCMGLAQIILKEKRSERDNETLKSVKSILKENPLSYRILKDMSVKNRLWLTAEGFSLELTSKIRNFLKKGN